MRKTWLIYLGLVTLLLVAGCESEDAPMPSNKDKDRVVEFVTNTDKALVKSVYEKYYCGLMYEYDPVLDFAYTASNDDASEKWARIELPMMREAYVDEDGGMTDENKLAYNLHVDKALTFIDTTIFKYIGDEGLITQKMPYKVLLCNTIEAPSEVLGNRIFIESDSRIGESVIGALSCVYNEHSIAISVNQDALLYNAERYRKDNFYVFLCRIMEMHNLYSHVPEEFSALSSPYYGRSIEEVYAEEFSMDAENVPSVVDKQWFFSKGFIDARYFYNLKEGIGLTEIDGVPKAMKKQYLFVADVNIDVRSFLNEMLHRNEAELLAFPDNIKAKMCILLNLLQEWGVDMIAFNPDLEVILLD